MFSRSILIYILFPTNWPISTDLTMANSKDAADQLVKEQLYAAGADFFKMREACVLWNQITPAGRRQCTEAKTKIYNQFVDVLVDSKALETVIKQLPK